jgi:DNA-binding LytR/AlgR family response regulator
MAENEKDLLRKIAEKLDYIDPPVKKFPVEAVDPEMGVLLIDLKDVCYITTKNDTGRNEIMLVTADGNYYSNLSLKDVDNKLEKHPHFLRTSKYYVVNLSKISGLKVNNSRDLWFEGIKDPITNGVTGTYLEEFEKRLK